jgi:hypothetical protein
MEFVLLLIRLILFAIFALAGIGKLLDLEGSEKAVKDFGTPEEFAKFFAVALPFAEIVFAVCLLFVETSWRNRRDDFTFKFYRRNDLAISARKGAGLSLFRHNQKRAGFAEKFDSQHYFRNARFCSYLERKK